MPRAASHRHVLRDLRRTIGKTQAQFAQMIGVQPITVNRIENGSLKKISPHLAVRIQVATGISITELTKGPRGKLIDSFGHTYSNETFSRWEKALKPASEEGAKEAAKKFHWWLEILLRAAARCRGGHGYNGAIAMLIQSMEKIRRNFGLGKVVDTMLGEYEPPMEWRPGAPTPDDLVKINRELEEELARAVEIPRGKITWSQPQLSKPLSKKKRRR
jgi:transcriptional regulator with XRE-family HTH domain